MELVDHQEDRLVGVVDHQVQLHYQVDIQADHQADPQLDHQLDHQRDLQVHRVGYLDLYPIPCFIHILIP